MTNHNYIGQGAIYGTLDTQVLTSVNGTTKTWTLDFQVGSAASLLVTDNGVVQIPGAGRDYTVGSAGKTIQFATAPISGHVVNLLYLGKQISIARTQGSEVNYETFTGNGSTTAYTLANGPVNSASVLIWVNGVKKRLVDDYVVSGSVVTFVTAPANTQKIDVYILGVEKLGVYKVEDGSITNSKIALTWTNYSPTATSPDGMALSGISTTGSKYMVLGHLVKYRINLSITLAAPLSNRVRLTFPPIISDGDSNVAASISLSSGATLECGIAQFATTSTVDIFRKDKANFTAAAWVIQIAGEYSVP